MPRKDPDKRKEYQRDYYRATHPNKRDPRVLRGFARPNTANPLKWKIASVRMLWEEYEIIEDAKRRLANRTMTPEMSVNQFVLYCIADVISRQRLVPPAD